MVRFTDKAREFWLEQSLDNGEMPKRDKPTFFGAPYPEPDATPVSWKSAADFEAGMRSIQLAVAIEFMLREERAFLDMK